MENITEHIIKELADKVTVARGLQIEAALERAGYKFLNADELHAFCRDRCTLVTGHEGKQRLYVDKSILVMEWNATPSVEYFGDRITVTI